MSSVRDDAPRAEQGAKRKKGFARHAPEVLPLDAKGRPDLPPVWRTDARVRQAIAGMSHGFCAYCQSRVSSTHAGKKGKAKPPGQVEHFRPKARFPAQAYGWKNYFLVCMGCNGAKHDRWPNGGYVRPDQGKPGSRFVFAEDGTMGGRKGDEQAKRTVEDLDLNRHGLSYHRGRAIESHLVFVCRLILIAADLDVRVEDLLIAPHSAFSEAINQNVRCVWASGRQRRRKRGQRGRGRPRSVR
ncbi:hypothetical protein WMF31_09785 [Sorangium sp. So ce1036]|uniref:hypothetical protein n=1 Tax=Sorangium sp. So ce1036 TaxID=3133328 RepID=UPI003F09710F